VRSLLATLLYSATLLAVATGCASTAQFVRLPEQSVKVEDRTLARIYVVRPTILGGITSGSVSDGETVVGVLGPRSFLCWEREPGALEIVWNAEHRGWGETDVITRLSLNVEAGRVYYVKVTPGGPSHMNLTQIYPEGDVPFHLGTMSPPKVSLE
jgi:hypothetical protein